MATIEMETILVRIPQRVSTLAEQSNSAHGSNDDLVAREENPQYNEGDILEGVVQEEEYHKETFEEYRAREEEEQRLELEEEEEEKHQTWEEYQASNDHSCYRKRAKDDHAIVKELLKPEHPSGKALSFPIECDLRAGYLKNPEAWIKRYKYHVTTFKDDEDYLEYVVGLLEAIVEGSPYCKDKDDICSPMAMLAKTVTVKALKARRDPMRTSLRLQAHLNEFAQKENDQNSVYDRKIEEIELIPKHFALRMMDACITPSEVIELMRMDDETMFDDVLNSENKKLIASKFYQKIVWQKFMGADPLDVKKDNKFMRVLSALKRFPLFIFWNIFYLPLAMFMVCDKKDRLKKQKELFFCPFSSYLSDLMNYSILLVLNLNVIMATIPDPQPTYNLIAQYNNGTLPEDDYRMTKDGQIEVRLPTPYIPTVEMLLWLCIFSRVLTEFNQAYQKKGETPMEKLKDYLSSASNMSDIALLLLLVIGMICKLSTYIQSVASGLFISIETGESLIATPLIYTIYFYSAGAVLALGTFLNTSTIHIPGFGGMLIAMRKMSADITRVIVLFIFFIVGFVAPLHGLVSTYRNDHAIDGTTRDDFHSYKSIANSIITLTWGMFGGLSFSEKNYLYQSEDVQTTIFMTALLVVYATIMGLMCMNILLAMMCSTYALVTVDKSTEWRYEQFESILDYTAMTSGGMPFLFPLCIPYIVFCMLTAPCERKLRQDKYVPIPPPEKDNEFAQFIAQHRCKKAPKVKPPTPLPKEKNSKKASKEEPKPAKLQDGLSPLPPAKPAGHRRPPVLVRSLTKDVIRLTAVMNKTDTRPRKK